MIILNENLADRFCISPALCSQTFRTWIRLLRRLLGHALVVCFQEKQFNKIYQTCLGKQGIYSNCRVILDCAEVFIERSKSLDNQAYTWSDFFYIFLNMLRLLEFQKDKSRFFYSITAEGKNEFLEKIVSNMKKG